MPRSLVAPIEVIIQRIKRLGGIATDREVAEALGLSSGSLSNFKRQRKTVPCEKIVLWCLQQGISANDVLSVSAGTARIRKPEPPSYQRGPQALEAAELVAAVPPRARGEVLQALRLLARGSGAKAS